MDRLIANYKLGKTLGIGSFGKVKAAEHVLTGLQVAIKILNRRKIRSMDMEEKVRREIRILCLFMHPHIIRLYEVIETSSDIFVVMEYIKSGELFDYIVERIVSGVEYCHRHKVVHRDLKPENLLLDSSICNVKIADFGLSNVMRDDGHLLKTRCGSPNYAVPEVISGKLYAGPEVDVWSCVVILYALLCGSLPFDDENIPNLFKKITAFASIYMLPSHLSPGARDLIPRMLLVDPMKRITIPEIQQHACCENNKGVSLEEQGQALVRQCTVVDEDVLQDVVCLGFDRTQLAESLVNHAQNKVTVAYYLILDNCQSMTKGYLVAEFDEAKTFGDLDMGWKKTARAFKVKCQWVALASSAGDVAPATGGLTNSVMTRSMHKATIGMLNQGITMKMAYIQSNLLKSNWVVSIEPSSLILCL
ncbi:hypothetical protein CY35_19G039400 [Sphagnum magellanicum]|nr:hypothetical protein CY35_19G039400 [Sphagnum magellanicum]